jgi:hypothetical protein
VVGGEDFESLGSAKKFVKTPHISRFVSPFVGIGRDASSELLDGLPTANGRRYFFDKRNPKMKRIREKDLRSSRNWRRFNAFN